MKLVCYCADDFAMNAEITHAILHLLHQKVIQATSCMTQSPYWFDHAAKLLDVQQPFNIGLHLNFTHNFNDEDYIYSLNTCIRKAWSHTLSRHHIRQSIEKQWGNFIEATGKQPDFIDGHQHVHQFPVIREILISFLKEKKFKGWIRSLNQPLYIQGYQLKTYILHTLGAKKLQSLCTTHHIPTNAYFAGIYNFSTTVDYAFLNQKWLKHAQENTLIMCHPSLTTTQLEDPIYLARINEYNYLSSPQFLEDCHRFNVQLAPIGAI